jgi:hypothetical protein
MKYMIGYPVWCKADMISWYMEGLQTNMHTHPFEKSVLFCFADCVDDSLRQYERYSKNILGEFRLLPSITLNRKPGQKWITESEQHNALLKAFMEDGQCDALIVPQDDMKFNGNANCRAGCEVPVLSHVDRLFSLYGKKLGCVTGRDTYYSGFTESAGSWWSNSNLKYRLKPGEFKEGYVVNRGPIVYPRHLVESIGYLDTESYSVAFIETDYSARASESGFVNGAMGMDIIHAQFGKCPPQTQEYRDGPLEDRATLIKRYPSAGC